MNAPIGSPLLAISVLLAPGCITEPDAVSVDETEQGVSNCPFIPGCEELLEATDGSFSASMMTYVDATNTHRRRLSVSYRERFDSSFLLCQLFPNQPRLGVVFVVGPETTRKDMTVSCPGSYGDNGGTPNSALFTVAEHDPGELWNTLFPPQADGSRWYALQVAATNAYGQWDSRYGDNYRLVLRRR